MIKQKILNKEDFNKYFQLLNENTLEIEYERYYSFVLIGYFTKNFDDFSKKEIDDIFKSEKLLNMISVKVFTEILNKALNKKIILPLVRSSWINSSNKPSETDYIYAKYCDFCKDPEQIFVFLEKQGKNITNQVLREKRKYSSLFIKTLIANRPFDYIKFNFKDENILNVVLSEYEDKVNYLSFNNILPELSVELRNKIINKEVKFLMEIEADNEKLNAHMDGLFYFDFIYEFLLRDKNKCIDFISQKKKIGNTLSNSIQYNIINQKSDLINMEKNKITYIYNELKDFILEPVINCVGVAEEKEDFFSKLITQNLFNATIFFNHLKDKLSEEYKEKLICLNINEFLISPINSVRIDALLNVVEEKKLYFNYKEKMLNFIKERRLNWSSYDDNLKDCDEKERLLNIIFNKVSLELSLDKKPLNKSIRKI